MVAASDEQSRSRYNAFADPIGDHPDGAPELVLVDPTRRDRDRVDFKHPIEH